MSIKDSSFTIISSEFCQSQVTFGNLHFIFKQRRALKTLTEELQKYLIFADHSALNEIHALLYTKKIKTISKKKSRFQIEKDAHRLFESVTT